MTLYQRLRRGTRRRVRRGRVRWRAFAATPHGQWTIKAARYALTAAILGYLGYRLTTIGWAQIWGELPRTPWFYIIFVGMYLTLPIFQSVIYALIFGLPARAIFPAALKKRVYNKDVMSYSGEVYLYFWARDQVEMSGRAIMHGIKDNAIISSITSTLVAFGLLAVFFFSGLVVLPGFIAGHQGAYVAGAAVVGAVLVGVGIKFRRSILQLPGRTILALFGLHFMRLVLVQGLQVTQWEVVAPEIDLNIWFTFLAVQIISNSLPLIPSRDLVSVAAAIEVARAVQVPEALIAGLMGVHSLLDKALNLVLFAAVSVWDKEATEATSKAGEWPEGPASNASAGAASDSAEAGSETGQRLTSSSAE